MRALTAGRARADASWPGLVLAIGAIAAVTTIAQAPRGLPGWSSVALAAGIYASSHLLRVARLLVLAGDADLSVRRLAGAHLLSSPAGFLPFKLGELVRLASVARAGAGAVGAVRTLWIERTFDAGVIALAGALAGTPALATWVAVGWLLATAFALAVLPENVRLVKRWLIRRYTARWLVSVLPWIHRVGAELDRGRGQVRGRLGTLILLTGAIWGAEVGSLVLLADGPLGSATVALLTALSDALVPVGGGSPGASERHALLAAAVTLGLGGIGLLPFLRERA